MNKKIGFIFFVFICYVAIRLVPFFFTFNNTSRYFTRDSYEYNELAVNIAEHGYYMPVSKEPGLRRTPGYPLYLAIIYKLFGVKPAIALFFQIILSGFIPVFIYLNASLLLSKRTAKIAAVISVFEPVSIIYANTLLSETLFVLFLLISTYFFIKTLKHKSTSALVLSALSAGVAIYIKPVGLYLPFIYALLYLTVSWLSLKDRIKYAAKFVVIVALIVSPWIIRNYISYGYKGFSSIQDINLYYERAAGVVAEVEHIPLKQTYSKLAEAVPSGLSLANKYQFYRDKAISIILHHPYAYLIVMLKGSVNMLLSPSRWIVFRLSGMKPRLLGVMWQEHNSQNAQKTLLSDPPIVLGAVAYQILFNIVIGLLIIIGIVVLAGEGFIKELLFLLILIAYFVVISAGPEANPRFRLAALPYGLMLASVAIAALSGGVTKKHYKGQIKQH